MVNWYCQESNHYTQHLTTKNNKLTDTAGYQGYEKGTLVAFCLLLTKLTPSPSRDCGSFYPTPNVSNG